MASYEELYNMIMEESVKGTVGRAGIKAADFGKKVYDGGKSIAKEVVKGYNDAKNTKVGGPVIKSVEKATTIPFTTTSSAIANGIVKGKELGLKMKYADNPEKLEVELKKNIEKLDSIKTDIMAIELWAVGLPLAIPTLGLLDNILKAIVGAGALAKGDKNLLTASVKSALVWAVAAQAFCSKILKKDVSDDVALKWLKDTAKKILNTLGKWAKSDQPLFVAKKGPAITSAKFSKKEETVKESVYAICESIVNEEISYEEAAFLMESLI